jgi:hypothetical protein
MFRRRTGPSGSGSKSASPVRRVRRAVLEALESRQLLSTDVVTNLNDSGAGSLRQTLASASAGDTIQFASNLSGGTLSLSSGELLVSKSLTITGLGTTSLTISGSNDSTVFNVASGVTTSISNLTMTAGNAGGSGYGGAIYNSGTLLLSGVILTSSKAELGGAIYNNGGNITITTSTISSNQAFQQGGGVLNASGGVISIVASTIDANKASEEAGGGICNEIGTVTITGSYVSSNTAGTVGGGIANEALSTLVIDSSDIQSNTAALYGGGIFNFDSASLTVAQSSTISSNVASDALGGGLFNYLGTANISNSTFTSNQSLGADDGGVALGGGAADFEGVINITGCTFNNNGSSTEDGGGGLYLIADTATINSSIFNANQAQYGAGIFQDTASSLDMYGTTLENNVAEFDGGGVEVAGAAAYFANDTLSGNKVTSGSGGGIYAEGPLTCANCTIAANVANSLGAGVYILSGQTVTIYNTIVSTNTKTNLTTASNISGTLDSGIAVGVTPSSFNLVGTPASGAGGLTNGHNGNIVGANPDLLALTNNGGPTPTMALSTSPASPAINAGDNALALDANANPLTTDQRGTGYPRIVGGTVDIGAYEVQGSNNSNSLARTISTGASPSASSASSASPAAITSFASRLGYSKSGTISPNFELEIPDVSAASAPFDPAQIRSAYAVNDIYFNGVSGTGAGQTIAIADAYNDPNIIADANAFSSYFNLPTFNSGGPTLQVLNETGGTSLPTNATAGTWDLEESLDVEWAHSIAPDANIILFEANSAASGDLYQTVATAAAYPGVSVVSMSWSVPQIDDLYFHDDEPGEDSTFTTPAGHQGVTFIASTGDYGAPGVGYPATSPNVVAAGGTSLSLGTDGSYLGETAWSGGGGGGSIQEAQPSYQSGAVTSQVRTAPDVSMDADPETGVYVLDTYYSPGYFGVGGTSLAAPMWAALFAIVDQGLAQRGQPTLDGPSQTLPMLYALPSSDFHDVTTGDNGYPALAGYDLATGLGTPIASLLVPDMAGFAPVATWTGAESNDWYTPENWSIDAVPNSTTDVVINSGNPNPTVGFSVAAVNITGGDLQLAVNSGASVMTSLTITGPGIFDVANNHIFIDFGNNSDPISSIRGDLTTGFSSSAWTGVGIDSSSAAANPGYALGYADGIDGVVSGLTSGQIEIAYTLYGDANLDGKVDASDFSLFAPHFGTIVSSWDQGDFNYDGKVDASDFSLFAPNFGLQADGADEAAPLAVVTLAPSTLTTTATTKFALLSNQSALADNVAVAPVPAHHRHQINIRPVVKRGI